MQKLTLTYRRIKALGACIGGRDRHIKGRWWKVVAFNQPIAICDILTDKERYSRLDIFWLASQVVDFAESNDVLQEVAIAILNEVKYTEDRGGDYEELGWIEEYTPSESKFDFYALMIVRNWVQYHKDPVRAMSVIERVIGGAM
ncbi:MAG: hypothetical protein ACRC9Y_07290 [Aeromonas veronii]